MFHILYFQVSHYERRIRTLEEELRDSKEQRKRALEEVYLIDDYYLYHVLSRLNLIY